MWLLPIMWLLNPGGMLYICEAVCGEGLQLGELPGTPAVSAGPQEGAWLLGWLESCALYNPAAAVAAAALASVMRAKLAPMIAGSWNTGNRCPCWAWAWVWAWEPPVDPEKELEGEGV